MSDGEFTFTGATKPEELLLRAAMIVEKVKVLEVSGEVTDEEAAASMLMELSQLCYFQGMWEESADPVNPEDKLETLVSTIGRAQTHWNMVSRYCQDTFDVGFSPLAMLIAVSAIGTAMGDELGKITVEAVNRYAESLRPPDVAEELRGSANPVPDIDSFTGDDRELLFEYFDILHRLGTFYHDRSRYATDEDRELHDRAVAIFDHLAKKSN